MTTLYFLSLIVLVVLVTLSSAYLFRAQRGDRTLFLVVVAGILLLSIPGIQWASAGVLTAVGFFGRVDPISPPAIGFVLMLLVIGVCLGWFLRHKDDEEG